MLKLKKKTQTSKQKSFRITTVLVMLSYTRRRDFVTLAMQAISKPVY